MESILPPVMPLSHSTGQKIAHSFLPQEFLSAYKKNFGGTFGEFWGSGIQTEDGAGVGLGFSVLVVATLFAALLYRNKTTQGPIRCFLPLNQRMLVLYLPWIALLVYMANAGMGQISRLLLPYYALLLPVLLAWPVQERVVRRRWWRWCVLPAILMAFSVVIMTPARPLFPAQTALKYWSPKKPFLIRAETSYAANAHRNDGIAPVRAFIPTDVCLIGFVSCGNDIEPSLWRPYGRRRVEYILPSDSVENLRQRGIQYVVVAGSYLALRGMTFDDWLEKYNAKKIGQVSIINSFPPYVPADWYVTKLQF